MGAQNVKFEHNTAGRRPLVLIEADLAPSPGLTYQNNITPLFGYGIFSSHGGGIQTLDYYFPGWVCSSNVMPGYAKNGQPGYPLTPLTNFYSGPRLPMSALPTAAAETSGSRLPVLTKERAAMARTRAWIWTLSRRPLPP